MASKTIQVSSSLLRLPMMVPIIADCNGIFSSVDICQTGITMRQVSL